MESHKNSMFQTTNQSLYVGFAWGFAWVHPHHGGTSSGHQGSKKDTDFRSSTIRSASFWKKKPGRCAFLKNEKGNND
jgi:hypothetical protein